MPERDRPPTTDEIVAGNVRIPRHGEPGPSEPGADAELPPTHDIPDQPDPERPAGENTPRARAGAGMTNPTIQAPDRDRQRFREEH